MAEVISKKSIVYDIVFETGKAKRDTASFNKEVDEVNKRMGAASRSVDAAAKNVTEFAGKTLAAGRRLKEIKNELNNFKGSEERFRALTTEAAKLQDQINKTNDRIRTLASSTRNIEALGQAVRGITGLFTAFAGAQALFGKESENLQRQLIKLHGALALLQGVQQAVSILTEQSTLKTVLAEKAQRLYTLAVGQSTGAMKLFRLALLATGIGAAIIAVALLAKKFQELRSSVNDAADAQNNYAAAQKRTVSRIQENQKFAESTLKTYSEQLVEIEELQRKLFSLGTTVKDSEAGIQLIVDLQKVSQRYFGTLKAGESSFKDINDQIRKYRQAIDLKRQIADTTNNAQILQRQIVALGNNVTKSLDLTVAKDTLALTLRDLSKLKDELIALGGDPAQAVEELAKEVEELFDGIKFDPNDSPFDPVLDAVRQIRDEIAEAFNFSDEIPSFAPDPEELKKLQEYGTELMRNNKITDTFFLSLRANKDAYIDAAEQTLEAVNKLAKDGSNAQIAFAGIAIFANQAQALSAAIAAATEAAKNTGGTTLPFLIPSFISIALSTFSQVNSLLAQAKAAQSNVQAFAEGEVDIHRPGEVKHKDSIPAVIMPGESVITTDRTKQYKPFLKAIRDGNLEELIRVDFVEPALAVKAMNEAERDSRQIDYSDRFYRQYLATGEGNITNKQMLFELRNMNRKLSQTKSKLRN